MTQIECEADTIDNFVENNKIPKVDFIKIDVEGAEYFVFQGGIKTITNHKPIVFTEMLRKWAKKFGYTPNDIITYFSQLGYKCFVSSNNKLKLINQVDDNTQETNYFFLHPVNHVNKINKLGLRC